ncbi:MAG: methionine gamma-lyase family protein [Clostridia bacterium]|jgi:cystathionine beta-lyase family protein involved in aluminum resistance|nr:methionine gamma-lyase family protein [Clostridia bacterium]
MNNLFFEIDNSILDSAAKTELALAQEFSAINEITEYNQQKVLSAFIRNKVSESDFSVSTGYAYGDRGREKLDKIYAEVFGGEDALVRHSFTCGTHTLAVALCGVLRPGDVMMSVTGLPYDTIHGVIGIGGKCAGQGSLSDLGIKYVQVDLGKDGRPDLEEISKQVSALKPKMVYIQRSRGYSLRPSLSVDEIGEIVKTVKNIHNSIIMVDNCYGEFVEKTEPLDAGADLMAGSLIKNAGGGIARSGGYIAGRKDLVELCSYRMTTPGLGREVGATFGENRNMFMGIFNAPHVTGEALKTAAFAGAFFKGRGYEVTPAPGEKRHDIIQSIRLGSPEKLIAFCEGIQSGAPVDSFVTPEPWDMPGYDSKVIMAAGAFIMGASIELSADAPLREPYAVWMQGGLNYHSGKTAVMLAARSLLKKGLL